MKSPSTGVFQDAGWVTRDGGAAGLMLIADRPPGRGGRSAVGDGAVPAGREAAKAALGQLGGEATALLTIAFMGPEEDILKGIIQVAPRRAGGRRLSTGPLSRRQVPAELEHTVGHLTWVGYLASGEQGCSVAGIPTHADLSVASLGSARCPFP